MEMKKYQRVILMILNIVLVIFLTTMCIIGIFDVCAKEKLHRYAYDKGINTFKDYYSDERIYAVKKSLFSEENIDGIHKAVYTVKIISFRGYDNDTLETEIYIFMGYTKKFASNYNILEINTLIGERQTI